MAYASALDEMKKLLRLDYTKLKGVAGTSIGAIFAASLASGMDMKDILGIARHTSLIDLVSPHISNLMTHHGLDVGGTVISFLDGHLGNEMKTFKQLYDETHIHLHVYVTNLNKCKSESISHLTHPDMPVAKGVFMSMCLPPLFAPVEMDGDMYVDGGIMNNYPIDTFDPKHSIGFTVKWGLANRLDSFESYVSRLTYCTLSASENAQFNAMPEELREQTIQIDCGDVSTLNWRIQTLTALAMEARGREAVRDFVKKFDLRALPYAAIGGAKHMVTIGTQTENSVEKNVGPDIKAEQDGPSS